MKLSKDLREFIALLNSTGVDYLIVGGYAVAFHGYPRYTGDIDILIRPSRSNAEKVVRVLRQFGFASPDITAEDFVKPDCVMQLGRPPNRIDLITSLSGVDFDEVWAARLPGVLDDLPAQFISREHLIANKRATGRTRDIADAEAIGDED